MTPHPTRNGAITVLLVEDNAGDARLILEQLRELPAELFDLERVDRLEPALARLRLSGVDVVLLDLGLPDSTGIETFRRAQHAAPEHPIVVISGLDDERVALEAVKAGAQDYLVKGHIEAGLLTRVLRYAIARKRSEAALAASEAHYRTILENVADAVFVMDAAGRFLDVNPAATALTGYSREELLRQSVLDTTLAEDLSSVSDRIAGYAGGRLKTFERRMVHKDGRVLLVEGSPIRLPDGRILTTARDVTERRRHEEQIQESEQRFRELAETVREGFLVIDPASGLAQYVNPAYEEIFEQSRAYAYRTPNAWRERIHPEDLQAVLGLRNESMRTGEFGGAVFRIIRADGSIRWIRGRATPVRDAAGQISRLVGIAEDITDLKRTEAQFFEAQKMEAVGRLAGGVAHDFNNVLTAILGYVELLDGSMTTEDPRREDLAEIRTAGNRAAGLTRQLLAFSRHQVLQLTVLQPNDVIVNLEKMLHRLIGEDVELRVVLAPDAGNARADTGQLEQVIVNLVVNARDAMPNGGNLTVETANVDLTEDYAESHQEVAPGRYLMVAVTDTGEGMSAQTQARIFEPFFTTKEKGRGTGLGLSTVYGIVRQSGGHIWVYSEPGRGTTFKIYLPRVDVPVEPLALISQDPATLTGTETVLLAEDDDQLRRLCRGLLARLGYEVLEAASAEAALVLAHESRQPIALLITDVVMPGASGPTLAGRLLDLRPGTKVLFMSGYTGDAIVQHGMLQAGLSYLQKPFSPSDLARRVRQVLDGR